MYWTDYPWIKAPEYFKIKLSKGRNFSLSLEEAERLYCNLNNYFNDLEEPTLIKALNELKRLEKEREEERLLLKLKQEQLERELDKISRVVYDISCNYEG